MLAFWRPAFWIDAEVVGDPITRTATMEMHGRVISNLLNQVDALKQQVKGQLPFTELLRICKAACNILAPLVKKLYDLVQIDDNGIKKEKADATMFTIADVSSLLETSRPPPPFTTTVCCDLCRESFSSCSRTICSPEESSRPLWARKTAVL
jgi:hypothetical protein